MIELSENIIKSSIIYALKQTFGSDYKYYDELMPEKFEKPSFAVSKIDGFSRKGYTGHEYKFKDNEYRYLIKYFTGEKLQIIEDLNNKTDILEEAFEYLNIVNLQEDGSIISQLNRVNDITTTISDGVLLFEIQFPIRKVKTSDITKVQENILTEYVKNI